MTIEELRQQVKEKCEKTNTRQEGIDFLIKYYTRSLEWSEREALEYTLQLFKDGTINEIKVLGI